MFKKIPIILFLIILSHCSLNNSSSMLNRSDEDINSDLSKLNFEKQTSFEEFKKNIIIYGKLSKFPKLD